MPGESVARMRISTGLSTGQTLVPAEDSRGILHIMQVS